MESVSVPVSMASFAAVGYGACVQVFKRRAVSRAGRGATGDKTEQYLNMAGSSHHSPHTTGLALSCLEDFPALGSNAATAVNASSISNSNSPATTLASSHAS